MEGDRKLRSSRAYIAVGCIAGVFAAALAAVLLGGRGLVSFENGWPDAGAATVPERVTPDEFPRRIRDALSELSLAVLVADSGEGVVVGGTVAGGRSTARPRAVERGADRGRPAPAAGAPTPSAPPHQATLPEPPPPTPDSEPATRVNARAGGDAREATEPAGGGRGRGGARRGSGRDGNAGGDPPSNRGAADAGEGRAGGTGQGVRSGRPLPQPGGENPGGQGGGGNR